MPGIEKEKIEATEFSSPEMKTKISDKFLIPLVWILIALGWILVALSVVATLGLASMPHQRNQDIEDFLNHPDIFSLVGTIAFIIGINVLTLFAMLFGIYAVLRRNPKGKPLVITSIILFFILTVIQFLPSSSTVTQSNFNPLVITLPESEYQVTFPHPVKKVVVTASGIQGVAYESLKPASRPFLRAEFINNINMTSFISSNLRDVLQDHARLSGLNHPVITETQDNLGKVGTYYGTKTVENVTIKIYGKMVVGDNSAIHCLVGEKLELFPSENSSNFLSSIKRK